MEGWEDETLRGRGKKERVKISRWGKTDSQLIIGLALVPTAGME